MLSLALPLPVFRPRWIVRARPAERAAEQVRAHTCLGQTRVRAVTEDGREGWACPCVTGPHRALGAANARQRKKPRPATRSRRTGRLTGVRFR